jgi:hypothetical protein
MAGPAWVLLSALAPADVIERWAAGTCSPLNGRSPARPGRSRRTNRTANPAGSRRTDRSNSFHLRRSRDGPLGEGKMQGRTAFWGVVPSRQPMRDRPGLQFQLHDAVTSHQNQPPDAVDKSDHGAARPTQWRNTNYRTTDCQSTATSAQPPGARRHPPRLRNAAWRSGSRRVSGLDADRRGSGRPHP